MIDGNPVAIDYMMFNLSSLTGVDIKVAKLRFKVTNDTSSRAVQTIKSVASTTWTESSLTYNNRPALGTTIGTFSCPSSYTWIEVDITAQVIAQQGQYMSIAINQVSSDSVGLYTKESASNKPVLIIGY